jgi:hypothetical protein
MLTRRARHDPALPRHPVGARLAAPMRPSLARVVLRHQLQPPELLDIARHATASQLERLLRAYRCVVGAEQAAAGRPERWLVIEHDDDGSVLVRWRFPAEEGALIVAALEAAQEHLAILDRPAAEPARDVSAETPAAAAEAGRSVPRKRSESLRVRLARMRW